MSIIDPALDVLKDKKGNVISPQSSYQPDEPERLRRTQIIKDFTYGFTTMYKPRVELNDMSVIGRMTQDQMAFNTYQSNDGQGGVDGVNAWRSNAVKPIIRNKVISIAAHATAHVIFPKIFAHDDSSDEQRDAAQVMSDLMEWAGEQSDYARTSLYATIAALVNPASIIHTEYTETVHDVKRKDEKGEWQTVTEEDPLFSGFLDTIVPVDELYIENIYEHNIQKQGWLIWRRVQSYTLLQTKYEKKYDNFKYVKPGVQMVLNDANQTFYEVYDSNLRQLECEEILYYNRVLDLFIVMVNGVMLTAYDNPNPRNDKMYPFVKFGYELIDEGKFFYYKSLVFKTTPDSNIINTLYPMIIDGTYLDLMPPMIVKGGQTIGSSVIVPGAVTSLEDENADLQPIKVAGNLGVAMQTLANAEESMDQSSQQNPPMGTTRLTAYAISRIEQQAAIMLGLFINMIGFYVKDYGNLRLSDILQYLTIAEAGEIDEGSEDILFKTFLLPEKQSEGKMKTRKIQFDMNTPSEPMTERQAEDHSFKILDEEGGPEADTELYKVNPELFRNLKYTVKVSSDVLSPMSTETEKAFLLEEYDRAINNPLLDPNAVTRDFLLAAYPRSKKDPDKYFRQQGQGNPMQPGMPPTPGMPQAGNAPLGNTPGAKLPQTMPSPTIKS